LSALDFEPRPVLLMTDSSHTARRQAHTGFIVSLVIQDAAVNTLSIPKIIEDTGIDTQESHVEKTEKNRHMKLICRSNRHKLTQ